MQGQDPANTILLDKGTDRLVEEAFDDAQLQPNTEETTGNERTILDEAFVTHDGPGGTLQEAVEAIGGRTHWSERVGIVHALRYDALGCRCSFRHGQVDNRKSGQWSCEATTVVIAIKIQRVGAVIST